MKILNKEDGIKKVYIQKNDLIIIKEKYTTIPEQLDIIISNNDIDIDDFIEIKDEGLIGYLNLFKWIIDYKRYQNITINEYNKLYENYVHSLSRIGQEIYFKVNSTDLQDLLIKKKIISKQIKDIYLILQNKYANKKIKLPIVPDYDKEGYKVTINNETYIIKQTLDSHTIIIEKSNKKIINFKELNRDSINMFNTIINKRRNNSNIFDEYQLTMNEDNNKAIITFNHQNKEKELIKAKPF